MFDLSSREAVSQDRYNCLFNLSLMHAAMSAFTNYSPGFDLWQSGLFNLLNPWSKWTSSAFSMGYYNTKCHMVLCATNALRISSRWGAITPHIECRGLSLLGLQRWTPTWPEGLCVGLLVACALTARLVQNVRVVYGGFMCLCFKPLSKYHTKAEMQLRNSEFCGFIFEQD